jgi:hypothetical protein
MRLALLVCLLLGVTAVCAYTIDYDIDGYDVDYDGFTTMGGRNRGYGGAALVLQPIVQRYQAPAVVQQKKQPIQLQLQQPVVQWQQPVVQQEKKAVRYAQPIVTYAQVSETRQRLICCER